MKQTRRGFCNSLALTGLAVAVGGHRHAWAAACGNSRVTQPRRIDAHVHLFNGTDLQISGFLKESVALEYPKFKILLNLIAGPLQTFVWAVSPTAKAELDHLTRLTSRTKARSFGDTAFESALVEDQEKAATDYAEFLRKIFQRDDVRAEVSRLMNSVTRFAAPKDGASAVELAEQVDRSTGVSLFGFIKPFFAYRYANYQQAVDRFTCHGAGQVDTFLTLMVDFDEPLARGKRTKSPISDQTAVMSKICQLAQGRLLALAPYCPFKDAKHNGASLKNVLEAWKRPGFVGAKMYPPMGFKPYGNGGSLDAALDSFYRTCIKQDAAVLAHAESSLCAHEGPCTDPGPDGWTKALDHVYQATGKPLRVSLGHFGEPLGKADASKVWPEAFVTLMGQPSGAQLYADLSYASEILDSRNDQQAIVRLSGLLKGNVLPQRLMYGSDWIMLGLEARWPDYADRMQAIIPQVETASGVNGLADRFFGGNARDWLGIGQPASLAGKKIAEF